ncbi:MAG: hypothetical protein ABUL44_00370, partial [Flavobacterium sp.]
MMKYKLIFLLLFFPAFLNAQSLYINEVVALNTLGIVDEENDNVDWIELYNAGSTAVQLQGMG